jgi:hypothetical protein
MVIPSSVVMSHAIGRSLQKILDALKEYSANNLKRPDDLRSLFEDGMKAPVIVEPSDLPDGATKKQEFLWQASMKLYHTRTDKLRSNLNSLYSVIWGQCSENLKTKFRSLDEYKKSTHTDDCVWLLTQIKSVMHQFDIKQKPCIFAQSRSVRLCDVQART